MNFSNILASAVGTGAVNITEFTPVSDRLARVIATVSGTLNKDGMFQQLTSKFPGVVPVRSSFRWLHQGASMVGFVTTAPVVREASKAVLSSLKVVAGNLYMDPEDESIWALSEGGPGESKYLSRKGCDNLASLIEAGRTSPVGSTPRMYSVASAAARNHEVVAYVLDSKNVVDIDYGFVIQSGSKAGGRAYRVFSSTLEQVVDVPASLVVGAYQAPAREGVKAISASADTGTAIEYYRKAYSYAPEYVDAIIKQIEEMAAL